MADTFGQAPASRIQADSSRFYAVAVADVAPNTIYCPAFSTSGLFGVAELPIQSGQLGAFSRAGVFAFDYPEGTTEDPAVGTPVYYTPSSATEGALSLASGSIFIGYVVKVPDISGRLCVMIAPDAKVATN
ncbi:DUF2190 family protein [Candidatus Saccharibacteria bacterium]|nr:DUF2190 family protein [Candidatus Saccharibacteria bacterium]